MAFQCVLDWAIKNFRFPIYDEYHTCMFEVVSIKSKDSIAVARAKLMNEILYSEGWHDLIAEEIYHAVFYSNENKDENKKAFDAVKSLSNDELKRLYQKFETDRINNGEWDIKIEYYRPKEGEGEDDA